MYKALANVNAEVLWLCYLLSDLCFSPSSVTTIWCDNLGATYLFANLIYYAHTKHVEVNYHFVRDIVSKKKIQIRFISFKDQLVDVFIMPQPYSIFALLQSKLHMDTPTFNLRGVLWNMLYYRKYCTYLL